MSKGDLNLTDEQWQTSSTEPGEEVEPRPILSEPGQFREPWTNYQEHETSPAGRQRRRRLLGRGLGAGVIFVALVASVVMLRPHRAFIAAYFDDLKKLALGEETSGPQQPSKEAIQESTRQPQPRKVRDESPRPVAVAPSPDSEASVLPQQPSPPQLQVQEHDNQRRAIQIRSGPVVRLRDWGMEGRVAVSGELPERQEMPTYPAVALRDGVQGTVVLRALVGRKGRVEEVQVLSGPSLLASAAVRAVRRWRYTPAEQNGEQVGAWKQITVEFTLSTN